MKTYIITERKTGNLIISLNIYKKELDKKLLAKLKKNKTINVKEYNNEKGN